MRRILWIFSFSLLVAVLLVVGAGLALASASPFKPGDGTGYTVQRAVERMIVQMDISPANRVERLLGTASRRADDLTALVGTPAQDFALSEVQNSLAQAVAAAAGAPQTQAARIRAELVRTLERVDRALARLNPAAVRDQAGLRAFLAWEAAVSQKAGNPGLVLSSLVQGSEQPETAQKAVPAPAPTPTQTPVAITPVAVFFQPGSVGAEHAFFALTGKHAAAECAACHADGKYAGTPTDCRTCHAGQISGAHYPGDCTTCHGTAAWQPAHFDHSLPAANTCADCHQKNAPAGHYRGVCSACHTTTAWLPATFDHAAAGATDCVSCHNAQKPAGHWGGQCSTCHSTQGWKPASFNHQGSGAGDCQSCHGKDSPSGHWNAQCSACHTTSGWTPATFNHKAVGATDCQSCHGKDQPANHYSGQCSACHSTSAWKPASFNHSGAADCQSCHQPPANHYSGQCSQCHATSSWSGAPINHSFPLNHGGANGQCASCHSSGFSSYSCSTCHSQSSLDGTHQGIPSYTTRCIECHPAGNLPGN